MKNSRGFSLIETMVVVIIIATLAVLTMTRLNTKEEKLKTEGARIESMTREVQSSSMASKSTDLSQPLSDWGYGIYLSPDNKTLITFKDLKAGTKIKYDSGTDPIISTYVLPSGVSANVFMKDNGGGAHYVTDASFVFLTGENTVDRDIWIYGGDAGFSCEDPNPPCNLKDLQNRQGIVVWYGTGLIAGDYRFIEITKAALIDRKSVV